MDLFCWSLILKLHSLVLSIMLSLLKTLKLPLQLPMTKIYKKRFSSLSVSLENSLKNGNTLTILTTTILNNSSIVHWMLTQLKRTIRFEQFPWNNRFLVQSRDLVRYASSLDSWEILREIFRRLISVNETILPSSSNYCELHVG